MYFKSLLMTASLLLLSSCGIKWDYLDDSQVSSEKNAPVRISSKGAYSNDGTLMISRLSYIGVPQAVDLRTLGRLTFKSSPGVELDGVVVAMYHDVKNTQVFIADAASLVGGSLSFGIPSHLSGSLHGKYRIERRNSDGTVEHTKIQLDADNNGVYELK